MKKLLVLLLAGCLLLSFAACNVSNDTTSDEGNSSGSISSSAESEEVEETTSEVSSAVEQEENSGFHTTGTIEETVLYEENNVKITATEIEYQMGECNVGLTIENNSEEDLSFSSGTMGYSCNVINGIMVDDGYMNCDVAAGKTAKESVRFSTSELMLYGIDRVAELRLGFTISNADYDSVYTTPVSVKTSLAGGYQQPVDSIKTALQNESLQKELGFTVPFMQIEKYYEQNDVAVESAAVMENSNGEQVLLLEVVNNGEQAVYFTTENIFINGLAVYSYRWSGDSVLPGTRRLVTLRPDQIFDGEYWDSFGMETLASMRMDISLEDMERNSLSENVPLQVNVTNTEPAVNTEGVEVYQQDGISVISKGIVEDGLGNLSALLLVKNTGEQTLTVGTAFDSLSINGIMNTFVCSDRVIPGNGMAALVINLYDTDGEELTLATITDMECKLEIRNEASYETIAEPKITFAFDNGKAIA